ncbi:MAG: hypothetical protein IT323_04540, partial [Anaerolineae bacterium]|nr:hypothetical protein [Anaerolineae bacterium]
LIPDDAGLRLVGGAPIVSRAPETPRTAAFTSSADTSLNPARPFTRYRLEGSLQPGDRLVFSLEGGLAPTPTPGPATGGFSTGANIFSLIVLAIALVSAVLIGALVIRRMPGGRRP